VITADERYGGSCGMFTRAFGRCGSKFHFVNTSEPERSAEKISPATRLLWGETPRNPTLKLADIRAIGKVAKDAGVLFAVDNTFASPYLQNPLDLGADIVMHSVTKYIGGHSDVVMGALVMNDK